MVLYIKILSRIKFGRDTYTFKPYDFIVRLQVCNPYNYYMLLDNPMLKQTYLYKMPGYEGMVTHRMNDPRLTIVGWDTKKYNKNLYKQFNKLKGTMIIVLRPRSKYDTQNFTFG